ncbi:MAG: O-antigen ligase domain-containing protein [Wenzhouxiangella sp.]|nr:MAG: O-antigen ligase domain-containing protein [Wenzhouxiangella sp.]
MAALLVLTLPLMMGNRTPETLTASLLALTTVSLLAVLAASVSGPGRALPLGWLLFAGVMTVTVIAQVLPWPLLVALFGPYPDPIRAVAEVQPLSWSPDPGATLRGWAAFVALFGLAWLGYVLPRRLRYWIWLAVVASALFQAVYGVLALALGWESILGIWQRHNTTTIHGSFSNRNLFAAYMALTWPLAVAVWHVRGMPLLARLPAELKIAGSLVSASLIGAAMLASTSRLGAGAGLFGMLLMLILWSRHRQWVQGVSLWPAYLAAVATFVLALWYGVVPLAERALDTGVDDLRFEVFRVVLQDFPRAWFWHGVGLGGFEAAFKPYQPARVSDWWDYLHSDALQWLVEMGLVGVALLVSVLIAVWKNFRLNTERVALYAGLAALCLVSLADFSWHIPATQAVLALYLGTVLAPRQRKTARYRRKRRPEQR